MDTPIWVKAGVALGFSVLILFGLREVANIAFVGEGGHDQHAGTAVDHDVEPTGDTAHDADHGEKGTGAFDLAAALAEATANDKSVKKCVTCHTFEQGGDNKIGPNLWNIVGQPKASVEGFSYSAPLTGAGGVWSYDALFAFISDPKGAVPGTKMSFAGLKKPEQAAAAIAYMRTMSDAPLALPAVQKMAEEAMEDAAHDAAAMDETAETMVGEATEVVEEAVEETVVDAEAVVEDMTTEAAEVADDAADAADEVATAIEETASEAADTVSGVTEEIEEATEAATEAATETVEEAEAITEETVDEAAETVMVAAGDPIAGAKVSKKCATCHTFDPGGANKVGPNLWGIVGSAKGAKEGYKYSAALAGAGGTWTEAELDAYSADPRAVIPGTKMTFAGIKKESDRADLIAFLKTLSE